MPAKIAKHIFFSGQVQGVGFRFTAHRIAMRYGLVGYVRNIPDGRVEVLAQGRGRDIDDFVQDIQETFSVSDVGIKDAPVGTKFIDFKITF